MEQPSPPHSEELILQGHDSDSIREYDNPMPGWWLFLFWATIVWTPVFLLGAHVFDFVDPYEEDLAEESSTPGVIGSNLTAENPVVAVDEEMLASVVADTAAVSAGATIYSANCAMCHGNEGQGIIGPNLTDGYWIHGSSNVEIYNVISDGVIEKGMTPWASVLSVDQRAQLTAYVRSIEGTNPANAKAAEGELSDES